MVYKHQPLSMEMAIEAKGRNSTHARALGGSKVRETSHKPRPRGLETAFVHELSVPDLVDVLITRSRKTNGFTSLTFKQRANLMLAILER